MHINKEELNMRLDVKISSANMREVREDVLYCKIQTSGGYYYIDSQTGPIFSDVTEGFLHIVCHDKTSIDIPISNGVFLTKRNGKKLLCLVITKNNS